MTTLHLDHLLKWSRQNKSKWKMDVEKKELILDFRVSDIDIP